LLLADPEPDLCVITGSLKRYVGAVGNDESFFGFAFSQFVDFKLISLEDHFNNVRHTDRTNFPQSSSFKAPYIDAFEKIFMVFNPRNENLEILTKARACVHCVLYDYRESSFSEIEDALEASNTKQYVDLKTLAQVRSELNEVISIRAEMWKLVLQHWVLAGHSINPGEFGFSREQVNEALRSYASLTNTQLLQKYVILGDSLFQHSAILLAHERDLYRQIYLGSRSILEIDSTIKRRRAACSEFVL